MWKIQIYILHIWHFLDQEWYYSHDIFKMKSKIENIIKQSTSMYYIHLKDKILPILTIHITGCVLSYFTVMNTSLSNLFPHRHFSLLMFLVVLFFFYPFWNDCNLFYFSWNLCLQLALVMLYTVLEII